MFLSNTKLKSHKILKYVFGALLLLSPHSVILAATMYLTETSPITISETPLENGASIPIKCDEIQKGHVLSDSIESSYPDTTGSSQRRFSIYESPVDQIGNEDRPLVVILEGRSVRSPVNIRKTLDIAIACGLIPKNTVFVFPKIHTAKSNLASTLIFNNITEEELTEVNEELNVNTTPIWNDVLHNQEAFFFHFLLELQPFLRDTFHVDAAKPFYIGTDTGALDILNINMRYAPTADFLDYHYLDEDLKDRGVALISPCLPSKEYFETYAPEVSFEGLHSSETPVKQVHLDRLHDTFYHVYGPRWYIAVGRDDEHMNDPLCDSYKSAREIYENVYGMYLLQQRIVGPENLTKVDNISFKIHDGYHDNEFLEDHMLDTLAFLFKRKVCFASDNTCTTGTPK